MKDVEAEKKVEKGVKSNKRWVVFWCAVLVVVLVIVCVAFSSQRRVTTGENPETTHVDALTCRSEDYLYPFLAYDESDSKEFRIVVTFNGDKFRSVSLQQNLYYSSEEEITKSETENHAAMNESFMRDGLIADAVNATYAKLQEGMRFGLYGVYEQMKSKEMKYLLIDGARGYSYDALKQQYEEIGLKCE